MKTKALNNILLDLPVQLDTLVRIETPSCCPYRYLSRAPPRNGTCHLWRPIGFVTLQGCTHCDTVEGRYGSWFVRAWAWEHQILPWSKWQMISMTLLGTN